MSQDQPIVDRETLLNQFDGDQELLREVIAIFLEDHEHQIQQIVAAVTTGDAKTLEAAAHTLKGSVANFGAEPARTAAFALEQIGRSGNLNGAREALATLLREIDRVKAELRAIGDAAA